MLQQDPFRQDAPTPDDAALDALIETGPVSTEAGRRAVIEESQVTDRVLGFIASDDARARDDQRALVYGPDYANRLTPEQANERFGVEGYLKFDEAVNANRAAEMRRQAELRRFREQTAARADLSVLDTIGASVIGGVTDPVMLPTWFIGGGAAAVRGLGIAAGAGRGARIARGAAIGAIDGLAGGAAAETINAAARLSTGEDYTGGDALRNLLTGTALGGVMGSGAAALTGGGAPAPRRTARTGRIADLIGETARARGENPATALRIAEIESGLDPRADNPASSASGVFQFLTGRRSAWRAMGGGDPFDADLNISRGVELLAENRAGLRRALGREPQEWELYLAHQQGQGGAAALLRDPNQPAVDALRTAGVADPDAAIRLNGGRRGMTAGQFAAKWRNKFGEGGGLAGPTIESLTPDTPPRPTNGLTDNERVGAFAESLEAIADDAPVDLGAMLARNGLDTLDEATAVPSIRGRWLEADTAVTRRGSEVPVRFAVVELADLKTSHTDDLTADAAYPQALQPRDRSRAGAQAENYNLERDLNPSLLMRDKAASAGAPIVSPDGLVESGNGRLIALRRSNATGTEAWGRYAAELQAQGIDTTGFDRPVLVRMRSEPMTGAARAELAGEMNVSAVEGFSPVEQARADARRLDADTLALIDGDDAFAAANRPFLRGFIQRVAPNDANALTDAAGALSLSGKTRVQAALVHKAYGNERLTAALFETTDESIRSIGRALADAAPAWAKMRAEAPKAMDLTDSLTTAIDLIREARAARVGVAELLNERLGQVDLFGGEALSPETGAMIRLMFRDDALTKPRGVDRIAAALQDYARGAAATPAGPDLFGVEPDGRAFLDTLLARQGQAEGEGQRGLAYAGGSEPAWTTREAEPAVLDLQPAERIRDGSGGPGGGQGGGGTVEDPGGIEDVAERLKVAGVDGVTVSDSAGHGPVLSGLEGRWTETVTALKALRTGDVRGALNHPAVGDIDMVWGQAPSTPGAKDGWGLAKLMAKHLEVIDDLPERLTRMSVTKVLPDRINLASETDRAAVRLDWDGEAKAWLVTAFAKDMKAGRPGGDTSVSAALEGPAPSPDRPTGSNIGQAGATGQRATPDERLAAIIAADPELKALMADTDALARTADIDLPAFTPSTEPSTVAEAIRAAAFCLTTDIDV